MIKLAEFVAGLVGGMVAYIVGTFMIDQLITGTTAGDNVVKTLVPIGIGAGIVIGVMVHMFRAKSAGGRG